MHPLSRIIPKFYRGGSVFQAHPISGLPCTNTTENLGDPRLSTTLSRDTKNESHPILFDFLQDRCKYHRNIRILVKIMLLEFRVKNFKSIKNEAIFSLNASSDKTFRDTHTLKTGVKSIPAVVSSAGIYGANASGKSNLIDALGYMKAMVLGSANVAVGQKYNVNAFKLDPETANGAVELEVTFLEKGVRYQYGFSMNQDQILEEWLLVYKTAKPQTWFHRIFDASQQKYTFNFGSGLTGQKETWRKATRQNVLFLSQAAQMNSEQLTPIFSWIARKLVIINRGENLANDFTIQMINENISKKEIKNFLSNADISIEDISIKKSKGYVQEIKFEGTGKTTQQSEPTEVSTPLFHHKTSQGEATFNLNEESLGTQRLFAIAGPILNILELGNVLVFDELESSLHTLLAKKIIDLFQDPEVNKHGAQLIFSTHDTALLQDDLLRRDQIWFIEKNSLQESELYPLTDFSPRNTEDIEKGYLMGRYGAIPFLHDLQLEQENYSGA